MGQVAAMASKYSNGMVAIEALKRTVGEELRTRRMASQPTITNQ